MTDRKREVGNTLHKEDASQKPLIRSLHCATGESHNKLNQLVLARIPRCLPPDSTQPEPYAVGLLTFASIYRAFESAWQLLSDYEHPSELSLETALVLSSLIHLNMPALLRTQRLRRDLALLLQQSPEVIDVRMRRPDSHQAQDFIRHIKFIACRKPHVLIAYAYVLYMALFNGGRWIREQLSTARDLSWSLDRDMVKRMCGDPGTRAHNEAGLSFWHFDGNEDGDDVKEEFKARLVGVGAMLTDQQRYDIVNEAGHIFKRCIAIIKEMDEPFRCEIPEKDRMSVHKLRQADTRRISQISTLDRVEWILRHRVTQALLAILVTALMTIYAPIAVFGSFTGKD